jgi:hypothetical protein
MQTKFINLHQYLSNILGALNNIPYEILNNFITTYCLIFIIVGLTLLGFVLYAERTNVTVASLLDTQADLEQRTNDNSIPLNLVFRQNLAGSETAAVLYDLNDRTGLRMLRLLPNRAGSVTTVNGGLGIFYRNNPNHTTGINGQGNLLIHANNYCLDHVDSVRPILTRGLPVHRGLPNRVHYPVTVLTILPDNNPNAN